MLDSIRRRFQIDWLVSNLRWVLLLVVVGVAFLDWQFGLENPFFPHLLVLLGVAAVYNLALTLLLVARLFPRPLPVISLGIDAILAVGLVAVSGGGESPLLFFSLLPIITAALRFSALASLTIALFITIGYLTLGFLPPYSALPGAFLPQVGNAVLLILAAVLTGLVGEQMKRRIALARRQEEKEELRRLRARHRQARLIFELASTLSATLNYQRVLEAMLDVSEIGLRELEGQKALLVGMVLLYNGDKLEVAASRHLPRRDQRVVVTGKHGIIAQALSSAEPILCVSPGQDPEMGQFVALHQCREAVAVPLRAGFENFGIAVFGSPVPTIFSADYQDLLVALCNQGVVALQNAQLYQSLMEEKERIVAVEEDARKKLSRDLHDGPTQSIAAIAMRANYARALAEKTPDKVPDELAHIEELARRTTKEIRHMLFTLRPLILETQGLGAALEQYVLKRAETDPLPIHLDIAEKVDQLLDKNQQGMAFYIIEEALSNARKHARANNIWVRMRLEGRIVVAEVVDDGVGFDVSILEQGYDQRGSLGMLNMRERAELAGGTAEIHSAPGQGTRVVIRIPLKERFG